MYFTENLKDKNSAEYKNVSANAKRRASKIYFNVYVKHNLPCGYTILHVIFCLLFPAEVIG